MTDLEKRVNKIEIALRPEQQIHLVYIYPGETETQALSRYQEENQRLIKSNDITIKVNIIRNNSDAAAETKQV